MTKSFTHFTELGNQLHLWQVNSSGPGRLVLLFFRPILQHVGSGPRCGPTSRPKLWPRLRQMLYGAIDVQKRYGLRALVFLLVTSCFGAQAWAQFWRKDTPTAKAQPAEGAIVESAIGNELELTQENGPWMIVAASFNGEGAQQQAQALVDELRTKYRLEAYTHEMSFKLGEEQPGRGVDEYGAPIRRRFRRGAEVRELAVLVGNYPSIDDPEAQRMLERVKSLEPEALNLDVEKTAQSMAQIRKLEDAMLEKLGKPRKRGPMAQAFFTRNPMLPREYFVPKGVDPFVAKMNEGVEHSLLDCPGNYTIRVATFRGKTILQTNAEQSGTSKSLWNRRKSAEDTALIEAAENAHLLTRELRSNGWEAYEFHDRTESIVTIGSFAQIAQQLPDGRVQAAPNVEKIVKTFSAAYDTPADPLSGIGNDLTNQRLVDQQEQQVKMQITGQQAQIVPGMNPKHVKILKGRGRNLKVERIIPLDIYPKAVEVPKRSVSSAYAG
jgi:hypothetical protein